MVLASQGFYVPYASMTPWNRFLELFLPWQLLQCPHLQCQLTLLHEHTHHQHTFKSPWGLLSFQRWISKEQEIGTRGELEHTTPTPPTHSIPENAQGTRSLELILPSHPGMVGFKLLDGKRREEHITIAICQDIGKMLFFINPEVPGWAP